MRTFHVAMVIAAVDFVPAAVDDEWWCVLESAVCFVAHLKEGFRFS